MAASYMRWMPSCGLSGPEVTICTGCSPGGVSGSSCALFGYPGVSLVTGPPYKQIGLAAKRSTSTPKKLVTLAAGATALGLGARRRAAAEGEDDQQA